MNNSINWFKLPLECRISTLMNNLFFSIGSNFNCKIISNNFNFLWGSHPLPILNKTSMPRLINSSQSRCLKAPNHLLPTPSHLNFLSPFIYPSSNLCHLGEVNVSSFPGGSVEKNPTVKQETWVQSLGWEDLLEKGVATHSSILPGESLSMDRGDWRVQSTKVAESQTGLRTEHTWLSAYVPWTWHSKAPPDLTLLTTGSSYFCWTCATTTTQNWGLWTSLTHWSVQFTH